jgi:peptidoglycan/xylan/chitin deacetylase (PgdA/CDA1 family)
MNFRSLASLLAAALVASCAGSPSASRVSAPLKAERYLAQNVRAEELLERLYYGYLSGQGLLHEFDRMISDRNYGGDALESSTYARLLAVRTLVDEFEHTLEERYAQALEAQTDPQKSSGEKLEGRELVSALLDFIEGKLAGGRAIPEGLHPTVALNLALMHAALEGKLNSTIVAIEKEDPATARKMREAVRRVRPLIGKLSQRAIRQKVDRKELQKVLAQESGAPAFETLESVRDELGDELGQTIQREIQVEKLQVDQALGRTPQSQLAIEPSPSARGNITGNGFPAGVWSLTYDDGPRPRTSVEILEDLAQQKVPATFFMLTREALANGVAARRIQAAGMDIASHSWTHPQVTKISAEKQDREISQAAARLGQELGVSVRLFRLPYGAGVANAAIRKRIADAGMVHVFWNVDTLDWQDKNPESIVERALKQMKAAPKDSGIILFHDIHPQSVVASRLLVEKLKSMGKKLCDVQSVVDQINGVQADCAVKGTP